MNLSGSVRRKHFVQTLCDLETAWRFKFHCALTETLDRRLGSLLLIQVEFFGQLSWLVFKGLTILFLLLFLSIVCAFAFLIHILDTVYSSLVYLLIVLFSLAHLLLC